MSEYFSSGSWTAAPGREDDFVAAWTDYVRWTTENAPGSRSGTLLQHRSQPNRFVSFGRWDSAEALDDWRGSEGFEEHVASIRELCEEFDVGAYERRAQFGDE